MKKHTSTSSYHNTAYMSSTQIDHATHLFAMLALFAPDLVAGCEREYRFDRQRRWRFDLAWSSERVAVEVDGGQWVARGGRHAGDGDREKLNAATLAGWRVLRYSPAMLHDMARVIAEIRHLLAR